MKPDFCGASRDAQRIDTPLRRKRRPLPHTVLNKRKTLVRIFNELQVRCDALLSLKQSFVRCHESGYRCVSVRVAYSAPPSEPGTEVNGGGSTVCISWHFRTDTSHCVQFSVPNRLPVIQ